MEKLYSLFQNMIFESTLPRIGWTDVFEVFIIAFLIYHFALWFRTTRAWPLIRGIVVILVFLLIAYLLQMNTILWLVKNASVVAITGLVVVFQPELRKALDTIGRGNALASVLFSDINKSNEKGLTDRTINEIVRASYEMGKAKTGALIVVARNDSLGEFDRTGIEVDGIVSSQLLINIFEHNTPLHDGAVIVDHNRVKAATCYLPLTDSSALSKDLGTRHRAGVGVSEVTDSITVIVSEETGRVSVAMEGKLHRNIEPEETKRLLSKAKMEPTEDKKHSWWKQRRQNEK